ncbi:MAG: hypothetical protein ABSH06_14290 [Thermodesulfobacteriota bacterium]|jgi:hypothetical protein
MSNCQDKCKFLVERDRGGELEQWCSLIGGRNCFGVTRCSGYEKLAVKEPEKPSPKTKA